MSQIALPVTVEIPQAPSDKPLFDEKSVGLATFFGTPVAGGIVMAVNDKRLGKSPVPMIVLGVLVTAAIIALAFFIPNDGVRMGIGVAALLGMMQLSHKRYDRALEARRQAGGQVGSRWFGFGVGFAGLVIFGGAFVLLLVNFPGPSGTRVAIGAKDEIYISGAATETDARNLGDALRKVGFLADRGVTVELQKKTGSTVIAFVVQNGVWDDAKNVGLLSEITRQVAPSVGGLPIKLELLNSGCKIKKELDVK